MLPRHQEESRSRSIVKFEPSFKYFLMSILFDHKYHKRHSLHLFENMTKLCFLPLLICSSHKTNHQVTGIILKLCTPKTNIQYCGTDPNIGSIDNTVHHYCLALSTSVNEH